MGLWRVRSACSSLEKRLAARVLFAGRVPDADLPAFYQACDLLVLPSTARTEAFGVVQIEAMAAGRPVVSTNLPTGVPWVNQDGVSWLVAPPGDRAALGDALGRLLDDPLLRQRLGEGARRRRRCATAYVRSRRFEAQLRCSPALLLSFDADEFQLVWFRRQFGFRRREGVETKEIRHDIHIVFRGKASGIVHRHRLLYKREQIQRGTRLPLHQK